jgi:hypothetical protein
LFTPVHELKSPAVRPGTLSILFDELLKELLLLLLVLLLLLMILLLPTAAAAAEEVKNLDT